MTISEIIKTLGRIQAQYGDLKVVLSKDEEQNALGDILFYDIRPIYSVEDYAGERTDDNVVVLTPAL